MKNFDSDWEEREAEDNRTFQIRGETFVRRVSVRPEVLFSFEIPAGTEDAEALRLNDARILSFIEDRDDAHARYVALRAQDENPLGLRELRELSQWLLAEITGRPTEAPSASPSGRDQSGTGSKEGSSLRAVEG